MRDSEASPGLREMIVTDLPQYVKWAVPWKSKNSHQKLSL